MRRIVNRAPFAVIAGLALGCGPVAAQWATAGMTVEDYRLGEAEGVRLRQVLLMTTPFRASIPLGASSAVDVGGAWARGSMTLSSGTRTRIAGPTDVSVRLSREFGPLLLSGLGLAPTGEVTRTLEEVALLGILSGDLLPFSVHRWGTGGAIGGEAFLRLFPGDGELQATVGGGYLATLSAAPLAGEMDYHPADEVRLRAELAYDLGTGGVVTAAWGLQVYGEDGYGADPVFQAGSRMQATLSFAHPTGARETLVAWGGWRRRGGGEVRIIPPEPGEIQGGDDRFSGIESAGARDLFQIGTELHLRRDRWSLAPEASVRVFRNALGWGQGRLGSVGAGVEYHLWGRRRGGRVVLASNAGLRFGSVTIYDETASSVIGWHASVGLTWAGGAP